MHGLMSYQTLTSVSTLLLRFGALHSILTLINIVIWVMLVRKRYIHKYVAILFIVLALISNVLNWHYILSRQNYEQHIQAMINENADWGYIHEKYIVNWKLGDLYDLTVR